MFIQASTSLSGSSGVTVEFEEPEITRYIGRTFQSKTIFTARLDLGPNPEKIDPQHQAFLYEKGRRQVRHKMLLDYCGKAVKWNSVCCNISSKQGLENRFGILEQFI